MLFFQVRVPEWADIVKTSVAKELAPYDEDWYFTRVASVARHIYVRSPVGVKTITKIYGGKYKEDQLLFTCLLPNVPSGVQIPFAL